MIVEMVDPCGQALREIADGRMFRNDVALTYAFIIRQRITGPELAAVNKAAMERWSRSGLEYIKKRAWAIVEGRIEP